jgi:predicted kinase
MANLYVLCGIPGCGKSSWARNLMPRVPVVSSDSIREEMGDVNDQTRNSAVFDQFHARIGYLLSTGMDVVADSTALDTMARERLRTVAKNHRADVHLIYFSNLTQAVMRNRQRERQVPEDVMQRMGDKYENFMLRLPQEAREYKSITEIRSVG